MMEPEEIAKDLVKAMGKQVAHDYVQKMLTDNIYNFPTNSAIYKMWNQVVFEISKHEDIKDGETSVS